MILIRLLSLKKLYTSSLNEALRNNDDSQAEVFKSKLDDINEVIDSLTHIEEYSDD